MNSELSPDFTEFMKEEELKSRAFLMADAMLEENPGLDLREIYEKALKSLKEHPEDFPEEITNSGIENHDE